VDEVVAFNPLTQQDFVDIAKLMVEELIPALREHGILFDYEEQALQVIGKVAFGHKSGARDIRRQIRKWIEDPICMMLAENGSNPPALIKAVAKDDKVELVVS